MVPPPGPGVWSDSRKECGQFLIDAALLSETGQSSLGWHQDRTRSPRQLAGWPGPTAHGGPQAAAGGGPPAGHQPDSEAGSDSGRGGSGAAATDRLRPASWAGP